MKTFGAFLFGMVATIVLVVIVGVCLVRGRGFSAIDKPSTVEVSVALRLRNLAIPETARSLENPVPMSEDAVDEGREHFAEHCAGCHGKDGSGKSEIGQLLYPPAPDMRLARTQSLTDGELFYIIENGVPFTGMPAWGGGGTEQDEHAWHLVRFIRDLPTMKVDESPDPQEIEPEVEEEAPHHHHHEHAEGE